MGQQGKVLFKGILNSRGRTERHEATHTSNRQLIAAKFMMRFDDNILLLVTLIWVPRLYLVSAWA